MTVFRFRGAHIALVFAALLVAPLSGPVGLALAPAVAAQSANERGRVSVGGSKIISDATRVDDTAIVAEAETGNPGRYRGRTSDASNAALASKPLQWQRRAKTRPEWQIGWREGLPQNAPTRRRSMKRTLGGIALMGLGVAVLIASPEECLNDKIEAKIQEYRDADGRRNPSVPGGCITKFRLNSKLFRVNGVIVTDRIDLRGPRIMADSRESRHLQR
ncbi:MAG: hypothetical protein OXK20_09765, partial [Deltaproteobacteria bacterium]|nr:hypothetical protein [Deltaproteobacteria bacterium]